MTRKFRKCAHVEWTWGTGTGRGTIAESFTEDVSRQIEGTRVKRHADSREPAYLIHLADGGQVLKSHSELTRVP